MIVLGIDPGFTVTGYSIVCKVKGKDSIVDCGYLSLPSSKSLDVRIGIFYDFFIEKIKEFKITSISIETPFLGKNVQSFLKLGYLRGILYLLANQHNLTIHEFTPRQVKQRVTGFGGAGKEQVSQVLFMLFPALPKPKKDDVTDAIAVSLCGLWNLENSL